MWSERFLRFGLATFILGEFCLAMAVSVAVLCFFPALLDISQVFLTSDVGGLTLC